MAVGAGLTDITGPVVYQWVYICSDSVEDFPEIP